MSCELCVGHIITTYMCIYIIIYICNVALDPTRLYIHHGWFNHFNPHLSWLNPAISQFFALSYIVSELLFPPKNLLVLSREWMGCWGLLGWLLIVIVDHSLIPCSAPVRIDGKVNHHQFFVGIYCSIYLGMTKKMTTRNTKKQRLMFPQVQQSHRCTSLASARGASNGILPQRAAENIAVGNGWKWPTSL